MTAVELVIKEIDQQQKRYIDLAKKDKSIKKEVDAILTATTLLKIKCEQSKEMEKKQIIDSYIECKRQYIIKESCFPPQFVVKEAEQYYNETFKNK